MARLPQLQRLHSRRRAEPKCGLSGGAKAGVAIAVLAGLAGELALVIVMRQKPGALRRAPGQALRGRVGVSDADVQVEDPELLRNRQCQVSERSKPQAAPGAEAH